MLANQNSRLIYDRERSEKHISRQNYEILNLDHKRKQDVSKIRNLEQNCMDLANELRLCRRQEYQRGYDDAYAKRGIESKIPILEKEEVITGQKRMIADLKGKLEVYHNNHHDMKVKNEQYKKDDTDKSSQIDKLKETVDSQSSTIIKLKKEFSLRLSRAESLEPELKQQRHQYRELYDNYKKLERDIACFRHQAKVKENIHQVEHNIPKGIKKLDDRKRKNSTSLIDDVVQID